MTRFAFSSVRARLLILVLLVIIPALGLIIYIAREGRLQGVTQAGQSTLKLAREATSQQQRSISQTRDFLSELSQYPEIKHPEAKACPALLAKKLNEHPEYANVFVLTLDGELVCSARPFAGRVNSSDRVYFQLAVTRKSFSVGEYQVGRVTGKASLAFGHPVLDETGKFIAVLAAALDLTHLSDLIKDTRLPAGSAMLLVDSKGTVLVHHPDPQRIVGKSLTDQPLGRRLLASKGEGVGQEVGLDGVHRLYAFAPIRVGGDTRAYLGVGIPLEVAFVDANWTVRRNLILLGLVSLLAFGAAWFGGDFFILRRVNDLVSATRRLASGDLSARTALPYEESELGQLARAFDGMAESLLKRQAEIERAQKAIHYSDQRFRMTVEAVKDYAIIMLDSGGHVVSWNSGAERIKGYQAKEIIGKHFSCFYTPEDIEHGRPEHGLKVASSEGRFEDEGWRLRKDGSRFWANVVCTAVHDDRGQPIAFLKITRDLTERKRVEETLHDRHRELQTLYQIGQTVLTSPDLKPALEKILDEAVAVDSFDLGTILLVDSNGEKIEAAASRGYRDPANIERRPSEKLSGKTQYRRPLAWQDISIVENVAQTEGLRTLKREGVQSAVLTPVRAGEKTLGILQVGSRTPRQFDAEKVRLLEAIGNHMGVAIQKSRLYEEAKRNFDRIHALRQIDLAITSTLDLHGILHVLLEKIDLVLPYAATTVRLFNPENGLLEPVACRNLDEKEWKTEAWRGGRGLANVAFETNAPTVIGNAQTDPRVRDPEFYRKHKLISYLGIPLIAKEKTLGVIGFYTKQKHDFSNDEVEFLKTLAGQAAIAIYHAQLFEEIGRSKKELESTNQHLEKSLRQLGGLYTALTPIDPAASMPELMGGIIERLMDATGADAALIRVWDKEAGTLPIVGHQGFSDHYLKRVETAPLSGAVDWVIKHNDLIIAPDIASEPRLKGKVQLQLGLRSCAILPLNVHGEVRGILHVASCKFGYFNEEQKDHLTAIARQMSIALENRELFYSLKSSRDKLDKANQVKDEFLGVISHELRTPLNVIMGYSGLLVEGMFGELSPEQNNAVRTVIIQSQDLLSIVSKILQATQIESGEITVMRTAVNLTGFLDELKMAYDIPTKKELTMNWDYPFDLPFVETDRGKLKEILQSLISNALKFTEKGSVTITARHLPKSKTLRFTVADTGPGIPKEALPVIFDKFHQMDGSNTRMHGGLGLGLYIAKKYTELLGGEVEVKSDLGKGSTFTVTIPCETARHTTWQDDRLEQTL